MHRVWLYGIGISFSLGAAFGVGCAAGGNSGNPGGSGGAGGATGGTGGIVTSNSGGTGSGFDSGTPDGFGECTKFSGEAKQSPAALLFVLDRTASMNGPKWGAAQIAIVQAIDKDVFDTMSLGMLTFPSPTSVPGPDCIFNFPIYCDVSALPQIAVQPAGTNKSTAPSGVRHDIYQYLVSNGPQANDASDSSPMYPALNSAFQFLKGVPGVDRRIVVLITDGGGSCTSISMPLRQNIPDQLGCPDWEWPGNIITLINNARLDANAPINTFIVGVPGSNSTGFKTPEGYDTPPYHMLLALSNYAVNGSPETIDPNCDQSVVFTQNGPDPAKPCHIDLSNNMNFNANALADAIQAIRGKALGCVYDLPPPPPGQQTDKSLVNVVVTINGMEYVIPRRKDQADMCLQEPCWDYNADGKVELIGVTCTELSKATEARVDIYVGCSTILK